MRSIVRWAVRNSPAMNTLLVALLVVGFGSVFLLRRESFPNFDIDIVLCSVPYPGATPEEVERGICQKIEEAVRPISGVKKVTAVAQEGAGFVICELQAEVSDPQRVLGDIRSAVDRIPSFPENAEDPTVQLLVMRNPAIKVSVVAPPGTDPHSLRVQWQLREVAEQVRDRLLLLPAVSFAEIIDGRPYQIDVEIPEETLKKYGLTLQQVAQRIRQQNVELPAGVIRTQGQEILVRGRTHYYWGREIAKLPLITLPDGVVLTVGELGQVRDGFEDVPRYSLLNQRPALTIQVSKTADEDLLAITDQVRRFVQTHPMPPGFQLILWDDQSKMVYDRLSLLTRNGIQGLVLVFITLMVFLQLRLAFWVAVGIPISLLGTCAVMWVSGDTINMLTMFAFLMGLGIVVDDAIVVGENVYAHREQGKSFVQAAIDGTAEVAPSVISSVSTTIIAFMPLFFVAGIMGKFIACLPAVVISMLTISLLESLLVLPCHLAHAGREAAGRLQRFRQWVERGLFGFIRRVYLPLLDRGLNHPMVVYAGAVALLLAAAGLVVGGITPFVLFPKLDGDVIVCRITFPNGTPAQVTDQATARLEEAIRQVAQELKPKYGEVVRMVYRAVGSQTQDGIMGGAPRIIGGHAGEVWVQLKEVENRGGLSAAELIRRWREKAGRFVGVERIRYSTSSIGPGGKAIEFKVLGEDPEVLEQAVRFCKQRLEKYHGVHDVSDDNEPGKRELRLRIRPEAQVLGIDQQQLLTTVRGALYGVEVQRLQRGRHEVKLMVRYPPHQRKSLGNLDQMHIRLPDGAEVPLTAVAEMQFDRGYSEINRVDQLRSITITADVDEARANANRILNDFQAEVLPELEKRFPGVSIRWEGQREQQKESLNSLFEGSVVALFAMFVLLTFEFRSWLQPAIIFAIIPFGLVGAILGHLVMGMPLTLFSFFGLVALTGVVVNDSIVLIDFINHRREAGVPLREALLQAAQRRFRPVLLTSITTIMGLLPIVLERSLQAQVLIPMAIALAFGLAMSTLWVLVLVPVLYQTVARRLEQERLAAHEVAT